MILVFEKVFYNYTRSLLFSVLSLNIFVSLAQSRVKIDYDLVSECAISSGDFTPYMMTANRFDVLSPRSNTGYMSAGLHGEIQYRENWNFSGGLTTIASIHSDHKSYLQELYLKTTYRKIFLEVGSRQQSSPVINQVLSSGDFINSGNAKPIPMVHAATAGFVTLPYLHDWIESYADFGYGYLLDGDWSEKRFEDYHAKHNGSFFTKDVSFHHKELYLRTNSLKKFFATIGMQHSVFFGGIKTSYESGPQKISGSKAGLSDYFRVLIPKSDGSSKSNAGDSFVYGNHLGIWYADIAYNVSSTKLLRTYMEKPFEDGSGIAFRNGFDGIWGIEYSTNDQSSLVKGVVFEYIQTTNQSGPIHWAPGDFDASISSKLPNETTGADNYYNNFYYNGYSHYGMSLGTALLKSPYFNQDNYLNYIDNRVTAWHFGINGDICSSFGYLIKSSYREGLGTPFVPLKQKHHSFDAIIQLLFHKGPWQCSVSYALTQGNVYGNSNGADIKISYHGKFL